MGIFYMKQTQNSVYLDISNKGEFFLVMKTSEVFLLAAGGLGTPAALARCVFLCPRPHAGYPRRPRRLGSAAPELAP